MIKWGRGRLTTRHFLVVSVPGLLLGMIDNLIFITSFGYVHSDFGLSYMMTMSMRESRRSRNGERVLD